MRYLIRMLPNEKGGLAFLSTIRSLARSVMVEARNPKWTSYGALELDVFAPTAGDFQVFLAAVEPLARIEFSRDLNEVPPHKEKEELIEEARQFFNTERYWEAHEDLESVWRNTEGQEKSFLQGLILVCAALVHHQKKEPEVALGVLRRARKQLSYEADPYFGIEVRKLRDRIDKILSDGRFDIVRV